SHNHRTPGKLVAKRPQFLWELVKICRDKVVSDIVKTMEPEGRDLVKHRALVWNRIGQNDVKCGDAVGDNKEQCLAQVENFPHFTAAHFFYSGQVDRGLRGDFHGECST